MLGTYLQWILLAGILLAASRLLTEWGHGGREFRLGVAADAALRQLQVRLDALLSRLKRELGFEEEAGRSTSLAIAAGVLDGLVLRLHFLHGDLVEDAYDLRLRVEVPTGLSHALVIRREGVRSAVQQRLSGPDFEVGDAEADRELFIDGDPAELAALLDPVVVGELRWLAGCGGSVSGGFLEIPLPGDAEHSFHYDGLLRAIRLARALSLRVGERPQRLAAHLARGLPAALRLAAAEGLAERHAGGEYAGAAERTLADLLEHGAEPERARAARALATLRQARGLVPAAGGLAVHEGEGGALSLARGGDLALTKK